ncbi:hypothetical protein ACF1BE_32265 [Streptomyces sp. NPDC014991]|uniref:hypothetical protein n=1 Tax=Streptomyces sp. NPDC014991 TaxID=3364935 RepID=UPI0036FC4629
MLLEQNAALRRDLDTARAELRALRVRDLAAGARGEHVATLDANPEVEELRRERDQALAAAQRGETDLLSLRNVVQRLMMENTRLLGGEEQTPRP